MWIYEKRLQFPVNIKETNAKLAQDIISQYGGPDGELSASMRYLSQRYSMTDNKVKSVLTDIGTEELGHLEMIGSIIHQLTRDLSMEEIRHLASINTISIILQASGHRPPAAFHSTHVNFSAKGIL